jgi:hypothetical protein
MSKDFKFLQKFFSEQRLQTYLDECNGDYEKSFILYGWNTSISGALYESFGFLEIALRNAIDEQLKNYNNAQIGDENWLINPCELVNKVFLSSSVNSAIDRVKKSKFCKKSGTSKEQPLHHEVLSQMTLASWRYAMPSRKSFKAQKLWNDSLMLAFPNCNGNQYELTDAVIFIYNLRNRIAHHEPILSSVSIREAYKNVRKVTGAIHPNLDEYINSKQRITSILRQRP